MSKEKQIEEMEEEIEALYHCKGYADDRGCYFANSCTSCKTANREKAMKIAHVLYNAGYRKQSEGEWVNVANWAGSIEYECTACKERTFHAINFDYCPNCGAKMKGGAE